MSSSYYTRDKSRRFRSRNGKPQGGGFRRSPSRNHSGGRGRMKEEFNVSRYINKNPISVEVAPAYMPTHSFASFALKEELIERVKACGFTEPTPIQDRVIPIILKGEDVVGLANTGTGKTAAFLIPLIQKTLEDMEKETLIMAPTRELAIQIEEELRNLTKGLRIFSAVCVGGVGIGGQMRALRRKNHFVVGTPGRLLDLIKRKNLRLKGIKVVVLDEADRMLDMGFARDMKAILGGVPKERQTLFFSATIQKEIEAFIKKYSKNPGMVSVKKKEVAENIEQDVVRFGARDKAEVLCELLLNKEFKKVLVFGRTKRGVERLCRKLMASKYRAESIHGNKSHNQRQRALKKFKDSEAQILVATDVAARGLHVHNVTHVINFDLPQTQEDYVHRIGRTGRGEHKGKALTLVP